MHDVNKIQDFAPYVAKIKAAGAGHRDDRQLVQRPAAADEGRRAIRASRCASARTAWTSRATSANAGETALGHFNVSQLLPRGQRGRDGEVRRRLQGQDRPRIPSSSRPQTVLGIWGLGEALKKLKPTADKKLNVKQLAVRHGDRQRQHAAWARSPCARTTTRRCCRWWSPPCRRTPSTRSTAPTWASSRSSSSPAEKRRARCRPACKMERPAS